MKLLLEHLKNNRESLLKLSELVAVADNSVNLGAARESLISNFIQTNLPEYISYHTGEIFDKDDNRSGQIDIVLHPVSAPKIYLHNAISIFPAEAALAAIEVKSKLTTGEDSQLTKALSSCQKLKELRLFGSNTLPSTSIPVDTQTVPFIIFAFNGPKLPTLRNHLAKSLKEDKMTTRYMPDLIVVLDRGYYLTKTPYWFKSGITESDLYKEVAEPETVLLGLFQYILKLVERWVTNPAQHYMPIEAYTQEMQASIFDLIDRSS